MKKYPLKRKIRILFLSANPKETTQLAVIKECNIIDSQIQSSEFRNQFHIEQKHAVSLTELQFHLFRFKPNIVHFSGHGDKNGHLRFETPEGFSEEMPPKALSNLFRIINQNELEQNMEDNLIHCVILNACYSLQQAKAISEYVDCVIGISDKIADKSAINFAASFYQALGFGKSIQSAFELGRNQLEMYSDASESIIKLECRPELDPSKIFLLNNRLTQILPKDRINLEIQTHIEERSESNSKKTKEKETKIENNTREKVLKENNNLKDSTTLNNECLPLYSLGKYEEAIVCFDKVLEKDPSNIHTLNFKGFSLNRLGKYEEAIVCFDKVLEKDPSNSSALNDKGFSLNSLRKYEEAIVCFDNVLKRYTDIYAVKSKSFSLNSLRKYEEAIVCFDKALEARPDDIELLNSKGLLLNDLGKYEEAIVCFDKALEEDPSNIFTPNNRAFALYNEGKYEEAMSYLSKTPEAFSNCVVALNGRGFSLNSLGKYEEAIVCFDNVLIWVEPKNVVVLNNKGYSLINLGKYEEAIVCFDKALEVEPSNIYALNNKSLALNHQKI